MTIDSGDLLERFLRYVQIDTRSDDQSPTTPSTPGQWDLLRLLEKELKELGLADDGVATKDGYRCSPPCTATSAQNTPGLAWFAHVDTAPNRPSAAKPLVHRAYAGQPIVLPDDPAQKLTVEGNAVPARLPRPRPHHRQRQLPPCSAPTTSPVWRP